MQAPDGYSTNNGIFIYCIIYKVFCYFLVSTAGVLKIEGKLFYSILPKIQRLIPSSTYFHPTPKQLRSLMYKGCYKMLLKTC